MFRANWLVAIAAAGRMGIASAQGAGGAGAGAGGAPESQARANAAQLETATSSDAAIRLPKLHVGNAAEIEAGTWMQQHATSSKVKGFAKKMVKDHSAMDKNLRAYAQKHGVKLTGTTSVEDEKVHHAEALDVLKKMHGPQADRTYMQMMVQDHTRDVNEVKRGAELAKQGLDEDYSTLLDKAAKTMESHLEDAQKISREMVPRQARSPSS
jgi:putative membrane protein